MKNSSKKGRICQNCGTTYKRVRTGTKGGGQGLKFCGNKCRDEARVGFKLSNEAKAKISKSTLGRVANNKGKKKYSPEEEKEVKLAQGRKSYRKNIETRLFYYRQLSFKRRGTVGKFTSKQWETLKELNGRKCAICKVKEPFVEQRCKYLTIDHILPISKGGTNNLDNIQPLCLRCNVTKRDRDNTYVLSRITLETREIAH